MQIKQAKATIYRPFALPASLLSPIIYCKKSFFRKTPGQANY